MVVGGGLPGHGHQVFWANAHTYRALGERRFSCWLHRDRCKVRKIPTNVRYRYALIAGGFGNLETKWMDPPHATALH